MPVTKIRKEQLRLTLQDIFDLNQQHSGSWTVSVPNYNTLKILNDIYEYEFTSNNGLFVGSNGSRTVKISDSGVYYKSGSNYLEYLRDVTAGTGISISGTNVKTISVNLSAGTGISISGATITNTDRGSSQNIFKNIADGYGNVLFYATSNNDTLRFEALGNFLWMSHDSVNKKITYVVTINAGTGISISGNAISINLAAGTGIRVQGNTISVQYPTALLNEVQTWSRTQTFEAGIEITESGVANTNLGLKTTHINTFYEYLSPLRYGSLAPSGNQGLLFQFSEDDQILVFLNGQLLRGKTVVGNFTWGNEDYVWHFLTDRNAYMLCLREDIDSSRDIVTVFGLYKALVYSQ